MKRNIILWMRSGCAALAIGAGALLFSGCTGVTYSAGTGGYYDYDYYPAWNVYYYPQGRVYYWNDGGHWRSARRLPPRYNLHEGHSEHLHLHSRQPWTEYHSDHGGSDHWHH